uniref:Transcription initiation factor TFIID subunit 10 n=2 Tax=Dendroctonus ponderosae TaxID=77166 RepID=A0AAR5NY86_DENPD
MPFVSNIYKFVPPILEVISYLLENTWPPENISEFDMSSQCKDEPMEDESPITLGQPLSDFLLQLEDYTPTIPDAVTAHYIRASGFEPKDPRLLRLISIAAQKFISDVANDALQHCKMRTSNSNTTHASNSKTAKGVKDKKYCLTMEDLTPALAEFGIVIKKPHYYV